jgi:cytosine deaminase
MSPALLDPAPRSVHPSLAELSDHVLLPALVEPHAHLDKALTADGVVNPTGDLAGAIEAWLRHRESEPGEAIVVRARAAALRYVAHGTTAIRTHADVGAGIGLRAVEAVLAVRRDLAELVDIQVVVGVGLPIEGPAGAENRALARAALDAGADLVGGAPWLSDDPARALDALLDLASANGRGLDLHLDETLDPRVRTLDLLAERAAGFTHPITASHVVSLGAQPPAVRAATIERVARAGIAVVANPITNLYLQGRGAAAPVPRGLTALRELLDAGVLLAGGGDNVRDPFNPVGRADPLETASLLVTAGHLTLDEALAAVTTSARRLLERSGMPTGDPAEPDLVAIRASSVGDAIAGAAPARVAFRRGRVVARTQVETRFAALDGAGELGAW